MVNLTESQQAAVTTESSNCLVIAGAGAGKTRVLAERVAHLLAHGVSAADLMVVTFTRKAAGELIARVGQSLGDDRAMRGMFSGTFHSLALKILLTDGDKIGYDSATLTIVDQDDADLLLKQVSHELGWCDSACKKWKVGLSFRKVKRALEDFYATGELPQTKEHKADLRFKGIIAEYISRLYHYSALDFGMLLIECRRLLRNNDDVLARYQSRIKHLLVDEIQDANVIQHFGFLDLFSPPAALFAVGDNRQSIYGFRGARPDLMIERRPDAQVINLHECFRCGDIIVEHANRLIAHNNEPLAEPMTGATGRKGKVEKVSGRSMDVMGNVRGLHTFGYRPCDIAIMARSHKQLARLADCCREAGISHYRVGAKFAICDTPEFRMLHSMFRLVVNPKDALADLRIRGTPYVQDAERLRAGTDEWTAFKTGVPLIDDALQWFIDEYGTMPLPDALRDFAMRDSQDDIPDVDAVTLLTVHAAKGLEWPVVIVANCNEGSFPSSMAVREDPDAKEERRLMYVAVTRAAERVVAHSRRPEDQAQGRKINPESRFLKEMLHGTQDGT